MPKLNVCVNHQRETMSFNDVGDDPMDNFRITSEHDPQGKELFIRDKKRHEEILYGDLRKYLGLINRRKSK